MHRHYLVRNSKRLVVISALIFGFVPAAFFGCSNFLINYDGAKIRAGYEIPLVTDDKKMGHYTTRDLTVDYEYQLQGDTLHLSGKVRFSDFLTREYGLRYFNLSLLFADGENNIIGSTSLTSAGYGGPITFDRTLKLPTQATTMAFGFTYTGQSMGGGEGAGGSYDFWDYPVVR
ncbi:hypothetical protein [Desulfoferrobacter suflitae]|uniref:hypothetical protein n=1 Tax=Desulfoferrobacter suflitae TaxID=2865782 RepID=UPI0021644D96|nr:hypothetical protein [Desulfoferrobacter suflitae]MCK8601613.1 hypothetical protein [Desulfoferrobacter suflitae]